jgi:two-component system LytT family response regulator
VPGDRPIRVLVVDDEPLGRIRVEDLLRREPGSRSRAPLDDERFEQALARARGLLELEGMDRLRQQLITLLQGGTASPADPTRRYLERIAVESNGRLEPVPVSAIEYVVASGPYVRLYAAGRRHVIREAMQTLGQGLDPEQFLRLHRSAIVRLDLVESLERGQGGESEVLLRNGVRLRVSRSRREVLERWLGRTS